MSSGQVQFPEGFLWGAATAAYQIEGAVHEGGRGESIWDRFSHTPGKVLNGDTGDVACDHYHRWREDIGIMRELGLDAYRFSVAWPRILPNGRGQRNDQGLDFYDRLVEGLLEAGIDPWITLFHWDLPQALEDEGGWVNRATIDAFAEYTDAITRRVGDRVTNWITINEPWVVSILGYMWGIMAPGRTDPKEALQVAHSLLVGHGRAVDVVRANVRDAKVGITLNLSHVYPNSDSADDERAARLVDGFSNRWFLDPVFKGEYPADMLELVGEGAPEVRDGDFDLTTRPTDFFGINTYFPTYAKADPQAPFGAGMAERDGEHTATGWLVEPQGFEDLLVRVQNDYDPPAIYVTENGAAYDDAPPVDGRVADPKRQAYIHGHLLAARRAIDAGAKLRGYFAWSLLDNFEWAQGYSKRFGVTYVDYGTQARTIKDSGRWYAEVIEVNGIDERE
ncbi:MAG TPA: GH1 family beta-glucosidase [Thermomicrobiales bacterium]|nr:GH1 family beta-glucosidase [Thermomicrobiales bacterium]